MFQHEGTFYITLGRYLFVSIAIVKRYDAQQVVRQTHHIAMSPTTIIHIILSVIITEDVLVDRLSTIDNM